MREQIQKPESASRTIQSKTNASNQASIAEVLQAYKKGIYQRQATDEKELLQGKFETAQRESFDEEEEPLQGKCETAQREEAPNNTGLPDNLKSGIENLSGYSMDDVRVHYNSSKPAQLQALAYTQGTDIHVAPGQEQHLAHEAWHVVQQKQGRVQPTMQLQGVNVNNDMGLENEADRAFEAIQLISNEKLETNVPLQMKAIDVIQCVSEYLLSNGFHIRFNVKCPEFSSDGKAWWHLSFGCGEDGDYTHITEDGSRNHYFIADLTANPLEGVKAWTKRPKGRKKRLKTDFEYGELPENIKNFVDAYINILMKDTEAKMEQEARLLGLNPSKKT